MRQPMASVFRDSQAVLFHYYRFVTSTCVTISDYDTMTDLPMTYSVMIFIAADIIKHSSVISLTPLWLTRHCHLFYHFISWLFVPTV